MTKFVSKVTITTVYGDTYTGLLKIVDGIATLKRLVLSDITLIAEEIQSIKEAK